jgi:hypothetical protein
LANKIIRRANAYDHFQPKKEFWGVKVNSGLESKEGIETDMGEGRTKKPAGARLGSSSQGEAIIFYFLRGKFT